MSHSVFILPRRVGEDVNDTSYNILNIGKVPLHITVVEYFDRLSLQDVQADHPYQGLVALQKALGMKKEDQSEDDAHDQERGGPAPLRRERGVRGKGLRVSANGQ
jgi:hypothetical protein